MMKEVNIASCAELNQEIGQLCGVLNSRVNLKIKILDAKDRLRRLEDTLKLYEVYSEQANRSLEECRSQYKALLDDPMALDSHLDELHDQLCTQWPSVDPKYLRIPAPFNFTLPDDPKLGFGKSWFARAVASNYKHGVRSLWLPYRPVYKFSSRAAKSKIAELNAEIQKTDCTVRDDANLLKDVERSEMVLSRKLEALKEEMESFKKYPDSLAEYLHYRSEARKYLSKIPHEEASYSNGKTLDEIRPYLASVDGLFNYTGAQTNDEISSEADERASVFAPRIGIRVGSDDDHPPSASFFQDNSNSVFEPVSRQSFRSRLSFHDNTTKTPLSNPSIDAMKLNSNHVVISDDRVFTGVRVD